MRVAGFVRMFFFPHLKILLKNVNDKQNYGKKLRKRFTISSREIKKN